MQIILESFMRVSPDSVPVIWARIQWDLEAGRESKSRVKVC